MEELEIPIATEATDQVVDTVEFADLRRLVVSLLVLMIVISGTLNIYFLRQYRNVSAELKPARQFIGEYHKIRGPATDEFIRKLSQYSATHKDFDPIALKYGLKATNAVPAATPVPGTGLPKK